MATRRANDLTVVMVVAGTAMLLAIVDLPIPIVRAAIGVPLALVLPGYALVAALFARTSLSRTEWALGSVAGSMIIATLGGFVLNWTPWGLRPQTWAVLLGGITLAALATARRRREPTSAHVSWIAAPRITPRQGALFGLAALVFFLAAGVAVFGATHAPTPGFTQLWLLPTANASVRVGVRNDEGAPRAYTLRLDADGVPGQAWTNINLGPGETWETTLALSPQQQQAQTIEARLYRANADGLVYRRVTLER